MSTRSTWTALTSSLDGGSIFVIRLLTSLQKKLPIRFREGVASRESTFEQATGYPICHAVDGLLLLVGHQKYKPRDDGRAVPENNGRHVHAATGNRSHCNWRKTITPERFARGLVASAAARYVL
jgi:hypothetical protein